ncbi:MAG TPA: GNAT family N-acetyltransferase [Rhizomicrobium sp.]|nr:GNAT family N-acetyltransferase [Rhizomicrobium sp.]
MKTVTAIVRHAESAAAIGAETWNTCANPLNSRAPHPFTRHEFFAALEQSGSATPKTGWRPCHLMIEREGVIEGLLPLYLKNHSLGEYVFDHGWADAFKRAGGHYYPKLQACVPFTPVTGPRMLVAPQADAPRTRRALLDAGAEVTRRLKASSLHVTFMSEPEWAVAAACGYLQRLDQQFHWQNNGYSTFEDFLGEFSSARRKNLRKERAAIRAAGIRFDWLSGDEITEAHWDAFFAFYLETGSQKWGRPYLTREFFSRVGESMGEAVLLIVARRGERPIAGALNFFGEDVLYGRNWGAGEFVPFLHFETCYYQAIDFAIARGMRKVEAGAQGEHKLLRGYEPVATRSAHFIAHAGLRQAVASYLARERAIVAGEMTELAAHMPFRRKGEV